ncbi:MAG: hypothetical protein ACP5P1_06415 [Acidimicrobiales bacterium]
MTEQPYDQPIEGVTPRRRRRVPRAAATVGLTALLGFGGAGAAFALSGSPSTHSSAASLATSTSSGSSSSTGSSSAPTKPPAGPRGHFGPGFGGPMMGGDVLHGVFTVKNPSGSYVTEETQVGTVSSVSQSSITVKSADGYSQTYAVTSSTVVDSQAGGIGAVAQNDSVRITAETQSGTETATSIVDTTKIGASRQAFGFGAPPSSSSTSASGTNSAA